MNVFWTKFHNVLVAKTRLPPAELLITQAHSTPIRYSLFNKDSYKSNRAEAEKRSSVVSVTSTSGPQRSFSVVINEHHLCLHSPGMHEHCHGYQVDIETRVFKT